MLRKTVNFFKEYKQLGVTIVALVAGLALYIFDQSTLGNIVLGATAAISTLPIIWSIIDDLRHGKYGVDILAATAIITSVLLGEYLAGMIIVLMLTGGEALEDYAEKRAKVELTDLLKRVPKKAHLLKGRKTIDVPLSKIKVNDKLLIKPGEVVPVDCIITEGESSFDESSLTGESLPVDRAINDQVLSGSVNMEGTITVKALRTAKESQYEQIIKLVRSAASSESPFVRLADRYSIPFTIIAFIIAGTAWAISGDSLRFLQVLVVATPCPLILGAPIALVSGISRAAKNGIIVKNGTAMERLSAIKTMGFDKTGTLTIGHPTVSSIKAYGKYTNADVVAYAAALEQNSSHVLAKAVMQKAESLKVKALKATSVSEQSGHGLTGKVKKASVLVGKKSLMEQHNIKLPNTKKEADQTTSFVALNGTVIGSITFKDELRPESKKVLKQLKRLGIKHTLMVTGDNKATAKKIAKQLGITDVRAECLPADKLLAIQNMEHRPVAFVGDGVNDAPVLTAAEVGIALGARGSTAASETADVVIMLDDINQVAKGVDIAQNTFKIARQSILIGIFISIALMFVYSTGRFSPVSGAIVQEFVDIIVIINALRAHGSWKKVKKAAVPTPSSAAA